METVIKAFEYDPPNELAERRIKHWETVLSDAIQAVYVAQQELAKLYPQRFEYKEIPRGHTGLTYQRMATSPVAAVVSNSSPDTPPLECSPVDHTVPQTVST